MTVRKLASGPNFKPIRSDYRFKLQLVDLIATSMETKNDYSLNYLMCYIIVINKKKFKSTFNVF